MTDPERTCLSRRSEPPAWLKSIRGNVLARIEIDPDAVGSVVAAATKRGPRGLAINNETNELYVMNRLSNTISVIDTTTNSVTSEIPTGPSDPTPSVIRAGRGFLYDAKLSGSGPGSCAACHVDGEGDHLSLGFGRSHRIVIPGSSCQRADGSGAPDEGTDDHVDAVWPGKSGPYHWRGDKPQFSDFNVVFQSLMGGTQLSTSDMTAYTNFTNTITYMPTSYENLDRTCPTNLNGGNAVVGEIGFLKTPVNPNKQTCNSCHLITNFGSDLKINIIGNAPSR